MERKNDNYGEKYYNPYGESDRRLNMTCNQVMFVRQLLVLPGYLRALHQ